MTERAVDPPDDHVDLPAGEVGKCRGEGAGRAYRRTALALEGLEEMAYGLLGLRVLARPRGRQPTSRGNLPLVDTTESTSGQGVQRGSGENYEGSLLHDLLRVQPLGETLQGRLTDRIFRLSGKVEFEVHVAVRAIARPPGRTRTRHTWALDGVRTTDSGSGERRHWLLGRRHRRTDLPIGKSIVPFPWEDLGVGLGSVSQESAL